MQPRHEVQHRVVCGRAGRRSRLSILFTSIGVVALVTFLTAVSPGATRQARGGALPSGTLVWSHSVDGPLHSSEWVQEVAQAPDGTLYLLSSTGDTDGGPTIDFLLCAYNGNDAADPHLMRTRVWDGPAHLSDVPRAMSIDGAGNVITVGYAETVADGKDWAVVKWGVAGNVSWSRVIDGGATLNDYAADVVCDAAGDIYVCGRVGADDGSEAVLMKLAGSDGSTLWTARYAGSPAIAGDNAFAALAIDAQRNTYVTGTATRSSGDTDILTAKFDPAGQRVWLKRQDGGRKRFDEGTQIALGKKGAVVVAGRVTTATDETQHKVAVLRFSAKGTRTMRIVWQPRGVGDHTNSVVGGLGIDSAGDAYVAGSTNITMSRRSPFLATWDALGRLRWAKAWVGAKPPEVAEFNDVAVDAAGGAWVAGSFLSQSGSWDWLVARFKAGGSVAWSNTWAGPNAGNDSCQSLCLSGSGGLFAGGSIGGSVSLDAMAAKYVR
jgi:hypothetical protein